MSDSAWADPVAATADEGPDLTFLDTGTLPLAAAEIRRVIRRVRSGEATEFARDRNSICYRVHLRAGDGGSRLAVVKVPGLGPQRTNGDVTFAGEAAILARLPTAGIVNAYRLLARVRAGDGHFLLTTHLPGAHPDPARHPFDRAQLQGIFECLFTMDCQGLMHYDLKPANLLLDGPRHGLIDFEFARFESWENAYAPATATYCADFNASPNPHFPARTNVANFEFRTLAAYLAGLAGLAGSTSAANVDEFVRDYLRVKARYHERMGQFFTDLAPDSVERLAVQGGLAAREVRQRLANAAAFSERLAALLRIADEPVAALERALMSFRQCIFECRPQEANTLRVAALERARRGDGASELPADYVAAMAATFELVGRSR